MFCFTALVALGVFDNFEAKMCVNPRCVSHESVMRENQKLHLMVSARAIAY